MSDTNSFSFQEQTVDPPRSTGDTSANVLDVAGMALLERLGVGGMGEVYRFGDDALQRDLAIKILKAELRGNADAEERFLREARLTGSLQHPGIVPIHNLSRLADGRPCYTMKLVRGRTFADMLRDEPQGPERLPRLLTILERVCQAVAYAHSKHVIHRDLKPSNVMVGEFGEVQVLDWGLAKELHVGAPASEPVEGPTEAIETAAWVEEAAGLSRVGAALGTPAYMPPEQAVGDWAIVDERADVFSLGAILCEVLTGQLLYRGSSRDEVLRRARRGDVAEALGRLEQSGADASLLQLCRECLSAEREDRPRHAGVVAERLAAHQAEVQARLRRAEVERAAAEVKAREERKRRRLTAALAALLLLVVIGVGGALWWRQWQIVKTDGAVSNGLAQAKLLADQARDDPLQTDKYQLAMKVAEAAAQLAESGSSAAQRRAKEFIDFLDQEEKAAKKDRELLTALLDVRGPHEGPKYTSGVKETMMALAEPTADEQFAAAFRRWGVDVDNTPSDEAANLLKARPPVVVTEVIAALDEWTGERRRQGKKKEEWQRLTNLATLLDNNPSSMRRELREIMARGRLPQEWALDVLSAALRPVPIPSPVPLGRDRMRLRQLAEQTDAAAEPILGLLTLVRALGVAGEAVRAEQLLRAAIQAWPREVVLYHELGQLLTMQKPPRWAEAVECYASARVARPDLGVNLATALRNSGRENEGLALLFRLVAESPRNPFLHFQLADALCEKSQLDVAVAEYRRAIALDPRFALAHTNLGYTLKAKGQLDAAVAEYRQAIALDPKDAVAHNNLGDALSDKGQMDEAIAEYRQAIALDPKLAPPHFNLGNALIRKRRLDEAIAKYRQAIALAPNYAPAHNNLGLALYLKGRLDEAIAEYRQAIALDSKYAKAYFNLGRILSETGHLDEAIAECRQAIALDPNDAAAHHNLGHALYVKGQLDEAIVEYRQAITLDPNVASAHLNLGVVLSFKGQLDEGAAEYRQAIALDPKDAQAHYNLGIALRAKGQFEEAAAEYRKTIRLKPDYPEAHCNLGSILKQQGRFDEALTLYRRGHELGSKQPGWRYPSARWVRDAERMLALDKKLPAIMSGEAASANPGEAVALARMCQQLYKKRYATSARLYAEALALDPKLAADWDAQHRYCAAFSAALAAGGQGEDARPLPDRVAAMFRSWALKWLRDDLTDCIKLVNRNNPAANKSIRQRLGYWQRDSGLASVRDPQALDHLPDIERAAWKSLWRDVEELAKQTAKADRTDAAQKKAKP